MAEQNTSAGKEGQVEPAGSVRVNVSETLGVIALSIIAIILLIGYMQAQKEIRELREQNSR